jgi:hypothetical protein
LGPVIVILLSIPAFFALMGETAQSFGLGLFFPILWTSFSISNSLLLQFSLTVFIIVYIVFLFYIAYKKGFFETTVFPLLKRYNPRNLFNPNTTTQTDHKISARVAKASSLSALSRPHHNSISGKLQRFLRKLLYSKSFSSAKDMRHVLIWKNMNRHSLFQCKVWTNNERDGLIRKETMPLHDMILPHIIENMRPFHLTRGGKTGWERPISSINSIVWRAQTNPEIPEDLQPRYRLRRRSSGPAFTSLFDSTSIARVKLTAKDKIDLNYKLHIHGDDYSEDSEDYELSKQPNRLLEFLDIKTTKDVHTTAAAVAVNTMDVLLGVAATEEFFGLDFDHAEEKAFQLIGMLMGVNNAKENNRGSDSELAVENGDKRQLGAERKVKR